MNRPRNTDPFEPWNNQMYRDDMFAPHNDPMRRNDMFEAWNDPFSSAKDLNDRDREYYGLRRQRSYDENEQY
jgi:hypothetical protein